MKRERIEEFFRRPVHSRLLRFLLAAPDGIDVRFLTQEEKRAVDDLLSMALAIERDGKIVLEAGQPSRGGNPESADGGWATALAANGAGEGEVSTLLSFIQDLTAAINSAKSTAEVFGHAFRKLAEGVSFDIGAAVQIEQNLDLYLSKRPVYERAVGERLVGRVRETLQGQIPVQFSSTDVVVRSDFSDVRGPGREVEDPLRYEAAAVLRHGRRASGIVVLYRGEAPFSLEEHRLAEIVAAQASIVLGNIQARQQIQNLADTDDLTGIWNRRYFRRQLPAEVERARIYGVPLSLLMFDIDDFKEINDRWGHVMGDVALSELCGIVRETLRPPDLFARFGGDEFAIILPHTDLTGAVAVAERIIQRVREMEIPAGESEQTISFSVSIGVATFLTPETTASELTSRADEQLYLSKRNGKDRYSF